MRSRRQIEKRIEKLKSRQIYPDTNDQVATVLENAPKALEQQALQHEVKALKWALNGDGQDGAEKTLRDPMETTRQEEQGRMEIRLVDTEDPDERVTLAFEDAKRCRQLGRVLHEAALQMERAEARAQAEEGGE